VFVNSMSDLFHADVPDGFIGSVFETMAATPQHTYQILTKRPGRMRSLLNHWAAEGARHDWAGPGTAVFRRDDMCWVGPVKWPLPNVWLGVSVESQKWADVRIPLLLDTPAAVRFLSCEPLVGEVDLSKWLYHAPWNYTEFGTDCDCGAPIIDDRDNCSGPKIGWVIVGGESGPGARPMDLDWADMIVRYCQETETPVFVKQLGSHHGPGKGGDMATWPADLRVRQFPALPSVTADLTTTQENTQ
jgi:protein gp37